MPFETNLLDSEPCLDQVFVYIEHSSRQWFKLRSKLELGRFGYVKYVFDQLQRLARLFDQRLGIKGTRQCTHLYSSQILLDEILSMYRILILT